MTPAPGPFRVPVRWRIFGFMFGFSFLAYLQQKTITVAADGMMPALGLTQVQIGYLEQAFVVGYALFQLPGGIFGQWLGARRTFVIISVTAFLATIATPIVPALFGGGALFAALFAAQLLLGCAQAPIFPVCAGVFEAWFPPRRWSFVQGWGTMGMQLGAALTPPLIAQLMAALGWQQALLWASLPALALIAAWAWYGRNTPREHPSVSARELKEIGNHQETSTVEGPHAGLGFGKLMRLVGDRNVFLLGFSYLCMNYTFYLLANWVFLYLREERRFSLLEGGWLATAPPLAAAAGAGAGGVLVGLACARLGNRWGFRLLPLTALPVAGCLLLFAVNTTHPYLAVAALALCYGCVELTEGAYWGAGMTVGRGDTMAVCGFMNTGGNLGGIIGIPIVAYFSSRQLWTTAFLVGAGFAVVGALAWLGIDVAPADETAASVPAAGAAVPT